MVNKENDNLIGRLYNYKFSSATNYLEGESEEVTEVVKALAETFGNCGWIEGNIGAIIQAAILRICPQLDEAEGIKEDFQ